MHVGASKHPSMHDWIFFIDGCRVPPKELVSGDTLVIQAANKITVNNFHYEIEYRKHSSLLDKQNC